MKRKGVGMDVDREWELRLGGTLATWRTCRNPGAPTRAADRGVTPGKLSEAYGASRLGGRVGRR